MLIERYETSETEVKGWLNSTRLLRLKSRGDWTVQDFLDWSQRLIEQYKTSETDVRGWLNSMRLLRLMSMVDWTVWDFWDWCQGLIEQYKTSQTDVKGWLNSTRLVLDWYQGLIEQYETSSHTDVIGCEKFFLKVETSLVLLQRGAYITTTFLKSSHILPAGPSLGRYWTWRQGYQHVLWLERVVYLWYGIRAGRQPHSD